MPVILRALLLISSVLSLIFVVRRLKKAQVQIYDTIFWIALSVLFVVLSIFPQIAISLSELIGIQSPINMVFLIIIFFLLMHCFIQSLRFSRLEDQFRRFVGDEALYELQGREENGPPEDDRTAESRKTGEDVKTYDKKGK